MNLHSLFLSRGHRLLCSLLPSLHAQGLAWEEGIAPGVQLGRGTRPCKAELLTATSEAEDALESYICHPQTDSNSVRPWSVALDLWAWLPVCEKSLQEIPCHSLPGKTCPCPLGYGCSRLCQALPSFPVPHMRHPETELSVYGQGPTCWMPGG